MRLHEHPSLFAVLALAVGATVLVVTPRAGADAGAPTRTESSGAETLTVTGATDTVAMTGTASWRLGYAHTYGVPQKNVAVTASLKSSQFATPGTVRVPPDWTAAYSTNGGATYSATATSADNALKVTTPLTPSKATGRIFTLPKPQTNLSTGDSGGDGFTPTIINGRAYVLHHHEDTNSLQCVELASGSVCSGHPNGAYQGKTSDVPGRAAVVGTKLFYRRSNKDTGFGLFCFDTATTAACGTQPFFVARKAKEKKDRGSEPVAVGGRVYAVVDDHKLYCFDPVTSTNCSGYPKNTALAGTVSAPSATGNDRGLMDLAVDGTRIYLSYADDYALPSNNSAPTGYLHCFDTATGASCWGTYVTWSLSADDGFGFALFFRKNATGERTGICLGSALKRLCTDLDGKNQTITDTQDGMWGAGKNDKLAANEAEGRTKTFHGTEKPDRGVTCWDWVTDSPCNAGVFSNGRWYSTTTQKVYGVNADPAGRCGWGATHDKILFSFSLVSGAAGCGAGDASLTVKPAAFYCDGKTRTTTWDAARVLDANLAAGGDFTSLKATVVRTSDNSVVKGPVELVGTDGTVSLAGVTGAELRVDLLFTPNGTSPWNDSAPPKIELLFDGDPIQTCWDTGVAGTCTMNPRRVETVAIAAKTGAIAADSIEVDLARTCTGTVTGTIRINSDGTPSATDPPGPGIPLQILSGTAVTATTTTAANGTYRIELTPGTYTARIPLQGILTAYVSVAEPDGTNDGQRTVTVTGGTTATADFTLAVTRNGDGALGPA